MNLLAKKRVMKPKIMECETVVVSSDEEDTDAKSPIKNVSNIFIIILHIQQSYFDMYLDFEKDLPYFKFVNFLIEKYDKIHDYYKLFSALVS